MLTDVAAPPAEYSAGIAAACAIASVRSDQRWSPAKRRDIVF
jgi:hypothetical protein